MDYVEKITKQFYLKKQISSVEEMSARLFWIPNSLVIWMGCNIFSEDFTTKSLKFCNLILIYIIFSISQINSLFQQEGLEKLLFKLITFGILIQSFGKLYAFIIRRPDLMKSVELCKMFIGYLENSEMHNCFKKWIMIGFYAESILSFLFFIVMIFFLTYPVILYLVFDIVTLILPVVIPFTDETTILGFILNYFFQAVVCSMAFMAFLAAIMDVVIFVVHCLAFFETLEIMLDLLQNMIEIEQNAETLKEKQRIMRKLAEGHNWCYEYLDNFENCFQFYHLCDIASSIFITVLCLYGVTKVIKLLCLESDFKFYTDLFYFSGVFSCWVFDTDVKFFNNNIPMYVGIYS